MNTCFKKHNIPKLTQDEIETVDGISNKEIEYVIEILLTENTSGPETFTVKCYKTLKQKLIHQFHRKYRKGYFTHFRRSSKP